MHTQKKLIYNKFEKMSDTARFGFSKFLLCSAFVNSYFRYLFHTLAEHAALCSGCILTFKCQNIQKHESTLEAPPTKIIYSLLSPPTIKPNNPTKTLNNTGKNAKNTLNQNTVDRKR